MMDGNNGLWVCVTHLAHTPTKPVVAATPAMGLTNVANAHAEVRANRAVIHTFATVEARLGGVVGKVSEKPTEYVPFEHV